MYNRIYWRDNQQHFDLNRDILRHSEKIWQGFGPEKRRKNGGFGYYLCVTLVLNTKSANILVPECITDPLMT